MVQKLKLDVEGMTDAFFEDTRLLGVVSTLKNYQFCWMLNKFLGFDFRVNPQLRIFLKKRKDKNYRNYSFAVYEHKIKDTELSYYLYHNHDDGEYLLPEFKQMDFLWMIKGDRLQDQMLEMTIQSVKNFQGVLLVAELTNEKIKNKHNLIF